MSPERELAEPHLRQVLAMAGLDVEYTRAEGNLMYWTDGGGAEVPVLDFAGGYGSLMLGHNPPEIIDYTKELLERQVPIHAQFSRQPWANEVATALNRIIHRELGGDEPYYAIFANTGAEAIEAAVKHAEMDRGLRVAAALDAVARHVEEARAAVAAGTAALDAAAGGAATGGFEALADRVARENAERLGRPPLFLALEGGFHGKLLGSVQLTHNESYRLPFPELAARTRFVPLGEVAVLEKIVEEESGRLLDVEIVDGRVRLTERAFPVFCAFVLEPVQGEGGIRAVTREFAAEIQRVARAADFPVIVDEIQTGMGRSGAFFASSHIGLRGDYYALAKSLGGGIAKTSVMLVRQERYRPEFEVVHSSTFAKDGLSSRIALKVLELLEADNGRAYRTAAEVGARLRTVLEAVAAEFPGVVREVRGRGLMLGFEFFDQSDAESGVLRELSRQGFLGYGLAGYLLRRHRIRTFPTASAVNTLRFEPSILLDDTGIDRLGTALRDVCAVVRDQDEQRFTGANDHD
ncbi:aspartate aminotransferase family protein [Streptomyces marincola]|uniref:Aspartate aminotransferase family protein n=1 Tax=Streptomyces marincola TaxID=2878388 RepID=A0A1W7D235_9ACTN|nr:aminotransferase class III-fold pyridoxal phosphate-dependent enzyme [Streptomyces marincola]ARQ71065.1 aspartate aminotransferase family protein [Streptomyces marincola]